MAQTWKILRWLYLPVEHSTSSVSSSYGGVPGSHDVPDSPNVVRAMSLTALSGAPSTPGIGSTEPHGVAALLAGQKGHEMATVPSAESNTGEKECLGCFTGVAINCEEIAVL